MADKQPEKEKKMGLDIRDDRQMKAVTGLSEEQFVVLEEVFGQVYEEDKEEKYNRACESGYRKRKAGGGRPSKLLTYRDKLLFILFYMKSYPTFDVMAAVFHITTPSVSRYVHHLLGIIYKALERLEVVPVRKFNSPQELKEALQGIDEIIIDVVERNHRRPSDSKEQTELYSGKKKRHTVKNTVISNKSRKIIYVGKTSNGSQHDYSMLKKEFPPEQKWFAEQKMLVDLGYQGIKKDYDAKQANIPHKRPRKSKNNPSPQLTEEQKAENRSISKNRVYVEHSIGGAKRYGILVQNFRNRIEGMVDDVMVITSALWNFFISPKSQKIS